MAIGFRSPFVGKQFEKHWGAKEGISQELERPRPPATTPRNYRVQAVSYNPQELQRGRVAAAMAHWRHCRDLVALPLPSAIHIKDRSKPGVADEKPVPTNSPSNIPSYVLIIDGFASMIFGHFAVRRSQCLPAPCSCEEHHRLRSVRRPAQPMPPGSLQL